MRGVSVATQSVGLNMANLLSDGVRADILQSLLPRSLTSPAGEAAPGETRGELIPLNQVMTRGQDVTGSAQYWCFAML